MKTLTHAVLCITAFTMLAAGLHAAKSGSGKSGKKSEAEGITAAVGTISVIDAEARTLSVGGKDFVIAEKCTFIGSDNKNDLTIKKFKAGDAVTVTYDTVKGVHTATIIALASVSKSKAEKVSATDTETGKKKEKSKKASTN
ncbi:MAG: hypothetical protein AABZ39_06370 [Spirochaetota bacterium]